MAKEQSDGVNIEDLREATAYLRTRAFELKKGFPTVLYLDEVETVLEVLETGAFQEWKAAMQIVLPRF